MSETKQEWRGGKWLTSEVLPLAFRRTITREAEPQIEVRRTDGHGGRWIV